MSGPYAFVERERCPSCRGEGASLYRCAFDQPPIATFVRSYYKVDPALLAEGTYELMQCSACTLVWQRWIGDDRLLGELYGVWINDANLPEEDPLYRADIANVPLSRDAHELMAASAFLNVPLDQMTTLDYGMGWALWGYADIMGFPAASGARPAVIDRAVLGALGLPSDAR